MEKFIDEIKELRDNYERQYKDPLYPSQDDYIIDPLVDEVLPILEQLIIQDDEPDLDAGWSRVEAAINFNRNHPWHRTKMSENL